MAVAVAQLLVEMNLDVWLDLHELNRPEPSSEAEHLALTHAIETGLQSSTHLIALVTPQTQGSWWVPFEIGSCRALRKGLAFLLHRDVANPPSYMIAGERLADKRALCEWAEAIAAKPDTVSVLALRQISKTSGIDKFIRASRWG